MKKFVGFLFFSILMVFSLSQIVFAEIEGEVEREKEAVEKLKRKIIEKEEVENEVKEEVKKIPTEFKKLLPTEKKLEEITLRTIWKYIDKQYNLDEESDVEITTALLRDITRVYDPIVNKYKVATIQIEIIKYEDEYELESYLDEVTSFDIEKIFNNAYLIGSPSENIDCMFNHSKEGAITICITDRYVVQSVIF
ncbi:hypothetical protein OAQ30_04000, partial [Nitrosopumilus sp.]|nr:hypothetical protein [Nitrosopumilus sp.]